MSFTYQLNAQQTEYMVVTYSPANCFSKPKKEALFVPMYSSLHTYHLQSTFDPNYCSNGPADRNPKGKGVAIKYNSYIRYLNRIRKRNCAEK